MEYEDTFMNSIWEQQKIAMDAQDKWERELNTILNDAFPQGKEDQKEESEYATGF